MVLRSCMISRHTVRLNACTITSDLLQIHVPKASYKAGDTVPGSVPLTPKIGQDQGVRVESIKYLSPPDCQLRHTGLVFLNPSECSLIRKFSWMDLRLCISLQLVAKTNTAGPISSAFPSTVMRSMMKLALHLLFPFPTLRSTLIATSRFLPQFQQFQMTVHSTPLQSFTSFNQRFCRHP